MSTIFSPSILAANFLALGSDLTLIKESGADWIHCDVMDGHFVPNLSFGPMIINQIKGHTDLPLDVHLMISNPEHWIEEYYKTGARALTIHFEACIHHQRILSQIRDLGMLSGISIVPSTPVEHISEILSICDLVLIMSVNPGFGGQNFLIQSIDRIKKLAAIRSSNNLDFKISVDGGVNLINAQLLKEAGADIIVAGSAFFSAVDKKQFATAIKT